MFLWLWIILISAVLAPGVNRVFGSRGGWGLALVPTGMFAWLLKIWPVVDQRDVSASFDWVPALSLDVSEDRRTLDVHAMFVDSPDNVRNNIKNGFERRSLELNR